MEFKNDRDRLSAHILLEDEEECGVICNSLKKLNVLLEKHRSIESLWEGMVSCPSNFVIIDVRLMNSMGRLFVEHPVYKSGSVEVIIFHRDEDYPLLKLVETKNFFDFLPESVSYDIFLRNTVSKLRKIALSENKALESISEIEHLENRLKRTQKELLEASEIFQKKMQFNKFMEYFWDSKNNGESFIDCLVNSFEKTDIAKKIIIFFSGKERSEIRTVRKESDLVEAVAPISVKKLNKPLNQSFIEKTCQFISRDRLGSNAPLVRVIDCFGQSQFLIAMKITEVEKKNLKQVLSFFDNFLSSEYQSYTNQNGESLFIDEYSFISGKSKGIFLRVDLSTLFSYINKDSSVFLMKEFSQNLFGGVRRLIEPESKFLRSTGGVYFLNNCNIEMEKKLRKYFENFDYWNYFEDRNENFSRLIEPEVISLTRSEMTNICFPSNGRSCHPSQNWS